jgi:hypothetical protein
MRSSSVAQAVWGKSRKQRARRKKQSPAREAGFTPDSRNDGNWVPFDCAQGGRDERNVSGMAGTLAMTGGWTLGQS